MMQSLEDRLKNLSTNEPPAPLFLAPLAANLQNPSDILLQTSMSRYQKKLTSSKMQSDSSDDDDDDKVLLTEIKK